MQIFFFQECVSVYMTTSLRQGVNKLENRVTTKQKHTMHSQKPERREHKCKTKENQKTTKEKTERDK